MPERWDAEFSLALYNRTGKYYVGRDILVDQADLIGTVYFWRRLAAQVPNGIEARVIGKLLHLEIQARRSGCFSRMLPRFRSERRVIYPPIRAEIDRTAPVPMGGVEAPFLLTVGSVGHRKKQARAIRAFARSGLAERGDRLRRVRRGRAGLRGGPRGGIPHPRA